MTQTSNQAVRNLFSEHYGVQSCLQTTSAFLVPNESVIIQ